MLSSKDKSLSEDLGYNLSVSAVRRFQNIFDGSNDSIIMVDIESSLIVDANQTTVELLGYPYKELIGMSATDIHPDEMHELNQFFTNVVSQQSSWTNKLSCTTKTGNKIPAEISASILELDGKKTLLAMVRDNRAQLEIQDKLEYMAYHDALTNLPNRRLLIDRLDILLSQCQRSNSKGCLIFLDLDNFKVINDSLGHDIGDQLLLQFSERVLANLRQGDTFARIGGDEFVIVSSTLSQSNNEALECAHTLVGHIEKVMQTPFQLLDQNIESSFSAGIAMFPHDGKTPDALLKNADAAMYKAKSLGRNQSCFFTEDLAKDLQSKLILQSALNEALSNDEFYLVYQPKVDPISNKVVSAETLLRWKSATLGDVYPNDFIPILEENGQIDIIDQWVLTTACHQWKKAIENKEISDDLIISINVSAHGLSSSGFYERFTQSIEETGINPQVVEIEITEQSLLKNIDETKNIMTKVSGLGIAIALDDFGTGFSSLSYLYQLSVNTLKIDRSFTMKIGEDIKQSLMIESIIQMSHKLGIKIVAEGVETQQQQDFLVKNKCEIIQGYFHSKPLVWDEFRDFVTLRNS